MSLMTDASIFSSNHGVANLAKDRIKIKVIPELEKDLSVSEKISVIFLMTASEHLSKSYDKIAELLEKNKGGMLFEYLESCPQEGREEKLLEALLIIRNIEVIRKLGITKEEQDLFESRFVIDKPQVSPNVNRVLKTLYFLCEDLDYAETETLINKFHQTNEIQRDELELFLLFWIKKGMISISGKSANLSNLFSALKDINYSKDNEIYRELENFNDVGSQQNVQDAQNSRCFATIISNCQENTPRSDVSNQKNEFYGFKKGLCLIINEEKFDCSGLKKKYSLRKGSGVDVNRLKSTFQDFGFEVQVKENLNKTEFLNALKTIGRYSKEQYDCIVLAILSHGNEKTFVTSDSEDVKFDRVREEMCTPTLTGVVKMVLIQACQGDSLGREETDGPSGVQNPLDGPLRTEIPSQKKNENDNLRFCDFLMFVATVQKFRSVRNTKKGTWFIQTLCDVFQQNDEIELSDCTKKVMYLVSKKRGTVDDTENVVQIPEVLNDTTIKKFIFRKMVRKSVAL